MKASFLDFDFLVLRIKDYIPLNETDEDLISRLFVLEYFNKNEFILKEGDHCHKLYFITTGIVRFSLLIDGEDRTFVFRNEGAFCSDLESFLKKTPSRYTISAIEPTFAKEPNFPRSHDNYTLYHDCQVKADFFATIGNLFKLLFVSLLSG